MIIANTNTTSDIQPAQGQQLRRKKKCHGNRSDQRVRQRCHKQKMSEQQIEQLIDQRRNARNRNATDQVTNSTAVTVQRMDTTVSKRSIRVSKSDHTRFISIVFFLLNSMNHHQTILIEMKIE